MENEPIFYEDYVVHGIDFECKKELFSELYKMKHVFPEEGDVVFDISDNGNLGTKINTIPKRK